MLTLTHASWVPLHGTLIALASLTTLAFILAKGLGL